MANLLQILGSIGMVALVRRGLRPVRSRWSSRGPVPPTDALYLLTEEPQGAAGVAEARQADAEEVTVVGRVGGSPNPFVEGMAAFTIVDPKIPSCAGEEGCPTPWDYCCTLDQVKDGIAMVKVVDSQGKPVAADAKKLLGIQELSMVVVRGEAQRDEQGNLTVLTDKVYVKSP